ncbi:DUF1801 domain-containing protein [Alkalicoccus daliensis]|uniref:YdhG-like domain-containing protein n=1 Tax=Alkalicoccus daliensis TaxID=745820 RepID=A0A1H0E7L6_9BACI|nr:DUF1801 domain-containing protein [Alkalicoccus daliensis]SDN78276.1 hypothetical protein SAMN04488053_103233 [Alkalicoccus daliensis]
MNQEITYFIDNLKEPWQKITAADLREIVHQAIPGVQERMQYNKPHFLKNGKYAAVISPSKTAVNFTIFHTGALTLPEDMFNGPPERKTLKVRREDTLDSELLSSYVREASAEL